MKYALAVVALLFSAAQALDTVLEVRLHGIPQLPGDDTSLGSLGGYQYLYRAHPYYPYAMNLDANTDQAVHNIIWDKIGTACGLLAQVYNKPYIKGLYGRSLQAYLAERNAVVRACPVGTYGDVTLPIKNTPMSQLYKLNPEFDQKLVDCRNNPSSCPADTAVDDICRFCLIDLLSAQTGASPASSGSCSAIATAIGKADEDFMKTYVGTGGDKRTKTFYDEIVSNDFHAHTIDTSGDVGLYSQFPQVPACVHTCRAALKQVTGKFKRKECINPTDVTLWLNDVKVGQYKW